MAKIKPLMIGPNVCPTSIIVAKKPIEAPTNVQGTKSQTIGEVDESTVAKAAP
ncbi:MAG TPA: hypothetical protein VLH35_02115 [Candidatus Acidoferrales bacterium]|nr:hypothetical protein [Candidatus Acidoferrales bacterium]